MPVFALTIGWSAFLLFWVEPLVGQLVLPTFGGAPAVWATVLVFFQAVLLLGYLYGHASTVWLGPRRGAVVHIGLALAALAWLLVASLRTADIQPTSLPAALDVLRILALTVGPPVFVLATTTPLVSAWFARWRGGSGRGPVLALRPVERRLAPGPAGLPVPHRSPVRAGRPARGLGGRLRRPVPGARGRGVPSRSSGEDGRGRPRAEPRRRPTRTRTPEATTDAGAGRAIGWGRRGRVDPAGRRPVGAAGGRDDLHRHGPHLRPAPVGRSAGRSTSHRSSSRSRPVAGASCRSPSRWPRPRSRSCGCRSARPAAGRCSCSSASSGAASAIVAIALHGRLAEDRPGAGPPHRVLPRPVRRRRARRRVRRARRAARLPRGLGVPDPAHRRARGAGRDRRRRRPVRPRSPPGPTAAASGFGPFLAGAPARLRPVPRRSPRVVVAADAPASTRSPCRSPCAGCGVGAAILAVGRPARLPRRGDRPDASPSPCSSSRTSPRARPCSRRARSSASRRSSRARPATRGGSSCTGRRSTARSRPTRPCAGRRPATTPGPVRSATSSRSSSASRPGAAVGLVGLGSGTLAAYEEPGQSMTYFEIDPLVIPVAEDPRYFTYLSDAPAPADGRPGRRPLLAAPGGPTRRTTSSSSTRSRPMRSRPTS